MSCVYHTLSQRWLRGLTRKAVLGGLRPRGVRGWAGPGPVNKSEGLEGQAGPGPANRSVVDLVSGAGIINKIDMATSLSTKLQQVALFYWRQ